MTFPVALTADRSRHCPTGERFGRIVVDAILDEKGADVLELEEWAGSQARGPR